jgi:transposase
MPRKAHLEPYLSSAQLKERYQRCGDLVESCRFHLLWLVSEGWQIKKAALAIGFNYDYVREIVQTYNQQGTAALSNRRKQKGRPGRKALLNPEQLQQLQQALRQIPADGGIRSGPKVAQWIAEKTGLPQVRAQRGWDYLKRCRFSPQHPHPRHTHADAQAQANFKANLQRYLEQIGQQHPQATIERWAFDEHRLGLKR